jgi:hypothetical protein
MKIDECCEYAKENGFDSVIFTFKNITGETVSCRWLDAYFGLFEINGSDGFISVKKWKEITGDFFNLTIAGKDKEGKIYIL